MGVPVVATDIGGPYSPPGTSPPAIATVLQGSTRTRIRGQSVALNNALTLTTLGQIISSTLNTTKTTIEGSPVILGGSLTNLSSGYSNGTLFALAAIGVTIN